MERKVQCPLLEVNKVLPRIAVKAGSRSDYRTSGKEGVIGVFL
jgi:hypothetical protein